MIKITMTKQDLLSKLSKIECSLNKQIFMYSDNGYLIAETFNGELVSRVKITSIDNEIHGFCIDTRFLGIIKKLPNELITLNFDDKFLKITCAKVDTKINYIEGTRTQIKFDYENATKVFIPFFKAILKKILISIDKDNKILFSGVNFRTKLSLSRTYQIGNYKEEIGIKNKTNDVNFSLRLSNKYLYDAVKSFDGEYVQICINGDLKPIVLKNEANNGLIQMLLPIHNTNIGR